MPVASSPNGPVIANPQTQSRNPKQVANLNHHFKQKLSRWGKLALGVIAIWGVVAYLVIPRLDRWRTRRQPELAAGEHLTQTGTGLPGDPLNIALVGSEETLIRVLLAAGWVPADALSFKSSVRIAVDTVIDKPDPNAPVSNLFLFGRKEDLAFEKPVGHSPRERHHVRFWRSTQVDAGQPVWLGSATHDIGVELSRTTGEITHHIAPDVDAERDLLLAELTTANPRLSMRWITGFHQILQGRNGGGDPWRTDGRLPVVTMPPAAP